MVIEPDHSECTDRQLACSAQAGCCSAFGQLVGRLGGGLLLFLSARMSNRHDAEDLLQETFVRAYENIARYDPRWSFKTWLYTIASRLLIDKYRKKTEIHSDTLHEEIDTTNPVEEQLSAEDESRSLWQLARDVLTDEQYTAIFLRYGEDMSLDEITHVMNLRSGTVKVMLFRAREKLRILYRKYNDDSLTHDQTNDVNHRQHMETINGLFET